MEMTMEEAIEQAIDIAKNGTKDEQEAFVEWACSALRWLSLQGDSQSCEIVSKQYKAYLRAKSEDISVQTLMQQSGKSKATIYNLAKKLGRLPTLAEITAQSKKRGRPRKY